MIRTPSLLPVAALVLLSACRTTAPVLSPAEVYQRVADSAVIVRTKAGTTASGTVISSGAGVAIVLTARHVVASAGPGNAVSIEAQDDAGVPREMRAQVVSIDPEHDLALLRAETDFEIPALPLAEHEPGLYDELFVVAAPMGLAGVAAPAVLSAKEPRGANLWAITSFVFFGSSGGAVANTRAELVAVPVVIPTWKEWLVTQLALCVPLGTIREFLVASADRAPLPL